MSEIPFVTRLGDALDDAISRSGRATSRRPRRRRRFGGLAVAIFLLGAGGVTIAEILDDPEKLASGEVACYSEAKLEPDVISVQSGGGRPPTELCAQVMRTQEPLVACVHHDFVAVFPGRDTCSRLGLRPLPEGYEAATRKVAALRRDVTRLLRTADCIPPATLARRVQRALDRSGWQGWRAVVAGGSGPCGSIPASHGLDENRRRIEILRAAPRSLERLMASRGERLIALSGERCFSPRTLRRRVRRELSAAKRPLRFRVEVGPLRRYHDLEPRSRNRRFEEGCAVFETVGAVYPRGGGIVLSVALRLKSR